MSETSSTQQPVMAAKQMLQQMTDRGDSFKIELLPRNLGEFEQSLGTIYTELGDLFFEETGPSALCHFTRATTQRGISSPGILLTELVRNFMLAYANHEHHGSARSVFDELDAMAQSVSEHHAPIMKATLSEVNNQPTVKGPASGQILQFKTRSHLRAQ